MCPVRPACLGNKENTKKLIEAILDLALAGFLDRLNSTYFEFGPRQAGLRDELIHPKTASI